MKLLVLNAILVFINSSEVLSILYASVICLVKALLYIPAMFIAYTCHRGLSIKYSGYVLVFLNFYVVFNGYNY